MGQLSSVAGTNTITASNTNLGAYATGMSVRFIPANSNTGATTLNINSLGAKNVFVHGAACVGGELKSGVPVVVEYDGTQFNVLGAGLDGFASQNANVVLCGPSSGAATAPAFRTLVTADISGLQSVLGTPIVSTSGTSIDFTGIPSWAKKITINLTGVSLSGTANIYIQLGDSGGVETSGYNVAGASIANGGTGSVATTASAFNIPVGAAAAGISGSLILTLENAGTFNWCAQGVFGRSDANSISWCAGSKATSTALDRVRVTTSNGTDTFDAGEINILYE